MRRLLGTVLTGLAIFVATAPAAFGDASQGNQPQNTKACQAILTEASTHTPGAANGSAISPLIGAFCFGV